MSTPSPLGKKEDLTELFAFLQYELVLQERGKELEEHDKAKKESLLDKCPDMRGLPVDVLQQKLKQHQETINQSTQQKPSQVSSVDKNVDKDLLEDYKKQTGRDAEMVTDSSGITRATLNFTTQQEAEAFFKGQAENGREFSFTHADTGKVYYSKNNELHIADNMEAYKADIGKSDKSAEAEPEQPRTPGLG